MNVVDLSAYRLRRAGVRTSRPPRLDRPLGPDALQRIEAMQREYRLRVDRIANAHGLCPRCRLPLASAEHWFSFDARAVATHVECAP